ITNDGSLPNVQITGSNNLSCATTNVIRTASGGGSYLWSNGLGTNATATITAAGTYTVTVTGSNGCTATITTSVTFTNDLVATASNSGPYQVGNNIELSASGGSNYTWIGPNNFISSSQNPSISNALVANAGVYTVTVLTAGCSATATTNVVVDALFDPCIPIIDYQFVKAGNPYQPLFSLTNGMTINQIPDLVSIIAVPICPNVNIGSLLMKIQGTNINEEIIQNVSPYTIFDNIENNVNGRMLAPGVYTLTVTGYKQDNLLGGSNYGPVSITFTILPNTANLNIPTVSKTTLCVGSNLDVNFSTNGTFGLANLFKVELSDANGNFGSVALVGNTVNSATFTYPTIIGISNSAGLITCSIPSTLAGGTNYRIRVISTDGMSVSQVNSSPITIHPRDLNLVSPTDDFSTNVGTKQATNKVTASNKISTAANITYQAGKAIILNAGFEANAGTVFKAEIRGCEN
ncbi:immunoglobulin domain-containing protein, partial [Emticicia sp. W12TSBA100-4]|uniref:immunoglobulin domain-containing protein n=1 Tax=Emticicia sp. W12TSBA100-4 TaxID=3160965 RepID=UPI0033062011